MQKWRHRMLILMVLTALSALFLPLASFAAVCPMMNDTTLICSSSPPSYSSASTAKCNKCHAKTDGQCCGFPEKSASPVHRDSVSRAQFESSAQDRVLDLGCGCRIEPTNLTFPSASKDAPFAPETWVSLPFGTANSPVPRWAKRHFAPFFRAPPPDFSSHSRASRAPPRL